MTSNRRSSLGRPVIRRVVIRSFRPLAATLPLALLLGSCGASSAPGTASSDADVAASSATSESASIEVPDFTGPYKDELREYYLKSESEFFRAAISDHIVTDEEYKEAQERAKTFLVDLGFTGVEYFPGGGRAHDDRTDISETEEAELHDQCEWKTGFGETEIFYGMLRRNPDNVDWPTAERDCLVKAGLLPEGTTVEEMDEWYLSQAPGSQSQLAHQCSQDALGYLGAGQSGD